MNITDLHNVIDECDRILDSSSTHTLYFLNAHCFNVAQKDKQYYKALANADLLLNDGIGLKIASYFTRVKFKENLNGTDLIPKITELAARKKKKVFFMGGKEGIAQKAAIKTKENIPELYISGFHSGYFDANQEKALIKQINDSGTDLLVIGMGVPLQELWAEKNKHLLTNVKLIIAGGAILDFLSGTVRRAPGWMQKSGLEWVYRLALEPKRMWRRYLIGNVIFFWHIFRLKLNYD